MMDVDADYQENLAKVIESPYSRIPIYKDEKESLMSLVSCI